MAIAMKLFEIHPITAQEVFDISVGGVISQGCASVSLESGTGGCRYRGPNGTKCAAGFLIPDDKYKPEFEGVSWVAHIDKFPGLYAHRTLISELQSCPCHDWRARVWDKKKESDVWSLNEFKASARKIAYEYNLEWKFN